MQKEKWKRPFVALVFVVLLLCPFATRQSVAEDLQNNSDIEPLSKKECFRDTDDKGWATGWSSGELQTQIGTTNSDKKKLIMWVDMYWKLVRENPVAYAVKILYGIRSEDHRKHWKSWKQVNKLYSFDLLTNVFVPLHADLLGEGECKGQLSNNFSSVPNFSFVKATATRIGGASGLTLTWQK